MSKLLVIDDEPNIRFSIEQVFEEDEIVVCGAESADEGLRMAAEQSPDVVLLDIRLGDRSGLDVFQDLRRVAPKSLVIFITGHGTTDTAIEAMKLGAYDYLVKPLDANQLRDVVRQAMAIRRLMHVPALFDEAESPDDRPDRLIGSGPAMQAVCKQIGRVAPQDVNVLILGESGTGKGTGGPRHLSSQPPQSGPLSGHQLCRDSRVAAGKRALRTRTGRIHRRRTPAHRQVRTMPWRHDVSR